MSLFRLLFTFLAAFGYALFTGCTTSTTKAPPPPIIAFPGGDVLEEEDFQVIADKVLAEANATWADSFADPNVSLIIERAIQNNLNLQSSLARLQKASALAIQASGDLKPAVVLAGKGTPRDSGSGGARQLTSTGAALNISWEIALWNYFQAQVQEADSRVDLTSLQLEGLYFSLAAQALKAYFLIAETEYQIRDARADMDLHIRSLELAQQAFDSGVGTQKEVSYATARVSQARAALREFTSARNLAIRSIDMVIGRLPGSFPVGEEESMISLIAIPRDLSAEVLLRRPDIRQLPDGTPMEVLNLAGPNGGPSEILTQRVEAQEEGFRSIPPVAFREVHDELVKEVVLKEAEQTLLTDFTQSKADLAEAEFRFRQGQIAEGELIRFRTEVLSDQINLHNIRNQRLQERIDLFLALGGGFSL